MDFLGGRDVVTIGDLVESADVSRQHAGNILSQWASDGRVERLRRGTYLVLGWKGRACST
jgi:predicted transcriptional regulator of viral defense system